ncbi:hypothetical protein BIW11_04774, partial [Tropilaelaps mercedesae]
YTFHLSGRREDSPPPQRPDRLERLEHHRPEPHRTDGEVVTPTNPTDRLNLVNQQGKQQSIMINSSLPKAKLLNAGHVLSSPASVNDGAPGQGGVLDNYRTLPFKTHALLAIVEREPHR